MCSRFILPAFELWCQPVLLSAGGYRVHCPLSLSGFSSTRLSHTHRFISRWHLALQHQLDPESRSGTSRKQGTSPASPFLVTVPRYLERTKERRRNRQERSESKRREQQKKAALSQGNRRVCLMTCSDRSLNHHLHQTYDVLHGPTLCTQYWKRSDKAGKFFTVHRRPVNHIDEAYFGSSHTEHQNCDTTFSYLPINRTLVDNLSCMDIHTPTEIQTKALETISGNSAMTGGCTMLVAQTGQGKTLAYLVPIVDRLLKQQGHSDPAQVPLNEPQVIVVTPGRELACQIKEVCSKLLKDTGLYTSLLLGTRFRKRLLNPQVRRMDVLVASLGVLNKSISAKQISLSRLKHVVLDESDTLLDDSFQEDTRHLLSRVQFNTGCSAEASEAEAAAISAASASLVDLTLVSATVPREVNELLDGILMPDSLKEVVTSDIHSLQSNVEHTFHRVASVNKCEELVKLCRKLLSEKQSAIIFSNSAKCSRFVSHLLVEQGLDCIYLSAELSANDRQGRWLHFINSRPALISCTDIVSRGLDCSGVHHVINFQSAWNVSDYIHRAGRVGRAGSGVPGTVTSFVHKRPEIFVAQLIELSVRKGTMLKSVDANISKIIAGRLKY